MSGDDYQSQVLEWQMNVTGDLAELRRAICAIADRLGMELEICAEGSRGPTGPPPPGGTG